MTMHDIPQDKPKYIIHKEDYKHREESRLRWKNKGVGTHLVGTTIVSEDYFSKTWKKFLEDKKSTEGEEETWLKEQTRKNREYKSFEENFIGIGIHRFVYSVDPYHKTPAEGTMFESGKNYRWIPMKNLDLDKIHKETFLFIERLYRNKLILEKMNKTNFQKTLEWGVELGVEIAKDLEDNKLTLGEALGLWDNALRIGGIVKGLKSIPAEWEANKDSEEFMEAIITGVRQKVKGLDNDLAEKIVIQSIRTGIETGKLIDLCVEAAAQVKRKKEVK